MRGSLALQPANIRLNFAALKGFGSHAEKMGETVPKGLDRRGFIQLAAMGIEMTGSRNASAAPESETMAVVTRQPEPDFNDDENTANILIETLITWGATHVFGVVGDGINGITEALRVESC